jgi:hypothetical protein
VSGALPVMDEVAKAAQQRGVRLLVLPTAHAIEELRADAVDTNAILHLTC